MAIVNDQRLAVAVAVVRDAAGRYLISQRHPLAMHGSQWEFPGGKLEVGESPEAALTRELEEELGITPTVCRPLIEIPHDYPQQRVRLLVWLVEGWRGELAAANSDQLLGREGQRLRWVSDSELDALPFPSANRGIIQALRLPPLLQITPEPGERSAWPNFLKALDRTLATGIGILQLRSKRLTQSDSVEDYAVLAAMVIARCRPYGVPVMLSGSEDLVRQLGAAGRHLDSRQLQQLGEGTLAKEMLTSVSCHHQADLLRAATLGVSYALLSPVKATATHPDAQPLGWQQFQTAAADFPLPLYALGGMQRSDLPDAWQHGAQGIAAIGALWAGD
ncbi:MAG: Nudix family hydrolase [Gammaproteobacteria bacterium]|nr:Nudix family hydrolase [Gammaproteobacteria bacterium]